MQNQAALPPHPSLPAGRDADLRLPDGRTISYGLYGAADGPLVVVLDGPGSRGLGRALAATAGTLGVTLLVPDRPGFGNSTAAPGRSIVQVGEDLLALARSLGVQRFGIVAQSGGTPYALALAVAADDSVLGLSFVGAIVPLNEPDALQDVRGPMRTVFTLGRRAPWLLRPLIGAVGRRTRRNPEAAARAYAKDLPDADRAVLEDPAMWAIHAVTSAEAVSSPAAFAREARLLAQPWGVDPSGVAAPAALWVGELDPTHPPVMSRRMAQRLGDAPVTVVPGAATFGMASVFPDVLRHAAALDRGHS
jgi:pimeloyl-ACP methyl ester carboxylesterase